MIGRVRGVLVDKAAATTSGEVIVETGGVGYEIAVPQRVLVDLPAVGQEVTLEVHTHVREDAITLFGFTRPADRAAFRTLLGVGGVGPKIALAVLSAVDASDLYSAVARRDVGRLKAIPGIGQKIAERMVLELRDKMPASIGGQDAGRPTPEGSPALVSALVNLGYRPAEAERAASAVGPSRPGAPIPDLVREALRILEH